MLPIYKFWKCTPTATKNALHANFTYVHEKVILLGRSRLHALVVLVFAPDMQIQVAHALCKQGCRLISNTASKRIVTIKHVTTVSGLSYSYSPRYIKRFIGESGTSCYNFRSRSLFHKNMQARDFFYLIL